MSQNKKITITQNYLASLKKDRDYYKDQYEKVVQDRKIFREEFVSLLKSNVSMASKNEYFGPETMITKLSRLMNKVESWYWC